MHPLPVPQNEPPCMNLSQKPAPELKEKYAVLNAVLIFCLIAKVTINSLFLLFTSALPTAIIFIVIYIIILNFFIRYLTKNVWWAYVAVIIISIIGINNEYGDTVENALISNTPIDVHIYLGILINIAIAILSFYLWRKLFPKNHQFNTHESKK